MCNDMDLFEKMTKVSNTIGMVSKKMNITVVDSNNGGDERFQLSPKPTTQKKVQNAKTLEIE